MTFISKVNIIFIDFEVMKINILKNSLSSSNVVEMSRKVDVISS